MPEEQNRVIFTEEMKKTHTILVPNMLPIQFKLFLSIMRNKGFKMELLETTGPAIVEQGLKNVHNDTCYPALLVIGQLIDALESGKYELDKVALMITQTGGGCRASNYIHLLRKALQKSGYGYIPVVSLNVSGMEKNPGFKLALSDWYQLVYALLLGDLIMHLYHQTKPYEANKGDADAIAQRLTSKISETFKGKSFFTYKLIDKLYDMVLKEFAEMKLTGEKKVKVGIVGEIYVKFSPLGNNNLEKFLLSENTEVVTPGLLDFCLYTVYNGIYDHTLYKRGPVQSAAYKLAYKILLYKQKQLITKIKDTSEFHPPVYFENTRQGVTDYIDLGVKMGEGWLLTAEMVELINDGVRNIICTQPFGCLPNHIVGKGMIRKIKEKNHGVNIVTIDYDPGASTT
ncbi:MAG: 2-hydroxyacyl-CoA dehydratase, partial [Oscillospiraceae bacterium]